MTTLLHGFHAIAAQRGDGLHPELLRVMTLSHAPENAEPSRMVVMTNHHAGSGDHAIATDASVRTPSRPSNSESVTGSV